MIVQSPLALAIFVVISLLLPILVDLATSRLASSGLKSSVLLLLSLITGLLTEFLTSLNNGTTYDWSTALYGAVISFVLGVASFFGLTQPLGVSGSGGAVQRTVPGGVGRSQAADSDGE